jgi:hypothetical protein
MKIFSVLGPRRPLNRQTALGCLTTNLALPGFGSLIGGRAAGYPQALLGVVGLVLTLGFGLRFIAWALAHWSELYGGDGDPLAALERMWFQVRWALLGIATFVVAWAWALATSLSLLRSAEPDPPLNQPPKLG